MRIGRAKHLVLDFGTLHIRAIELTPGRNNKKFAIDYYQQYDAPNFPYDARLPVLRTEGKEFVKSIQVKRATVSLPGRGILVRVITVPKVPLGKLRDILKFEIQQQIPFPIEVVAWSYQIIAESDKTFQVLLCAAKKDLINDYIAHLVPFNLVLESLDTDFFALYNIYRISPFYNPQECQAVLDIGAQTANLIINYQDKILMRSLTTTGDSITSTLMDSQKIEFQDAEKIKIEQGMKSHAVASIVDSLNTELQNSIDYWRFTLKGPDLNRFLICGGTSKMIGLKEYLEQKLRVQVSYLNVLDFCDVNPEYQEFLADKGCEIVVACGIGLKTINQAIVDINMLPVEILRMREFAENRPYIFLSTVMAILLTLTPLFFLQIEKTAYENYKTELDTALKEYEQFKPQVEALQKSINDVKGKIGVIQNLFDKKILWLARILEIGNSLPSSRIYLNNIYPSGTQIAQAAPAQVPPAPGPQPPGPPGPGEVPPPPGAPVAPGAPAEPPPAAPAVAAPSQPAPTPPTSLPENIGVLTIDGEVVATDIRSAFSDFKIFVQKLSKLEFLSEVVIDSCELDRETGKLKFLLTAKVK
ncbi:MAG: pilus assembly protein PilM [Candidatus Omnitrophica bacterium]|nr:pilus assembly protein PilM [Candidatus Omnitrophota bacterium]MCM8816997.1 pilus assembly protein PilM [Candidatus Omnitrophota bacterium]